MKALIYSGEKQAFIKELPEPISKAGAVKVNVKYCGICGSDIGIFLGGHPRAKAPLILGHEFVGIVASEGKKFQTGDRVTAFPLLSCNSCLACRTGNSHVCNNLGLIGIDVDGGVCESLYVDEGVLFKIPEGVSYRAAVTIEPLAVILRAIHQSKFQALETVVVVGAGPIGIIAGIVLLHFGASKVFISDISKKRLELAKELGLTPVDASKENLNEIVKAATNFEGCDVLFECSGSEMAALEMTEITRVRGRICMVAVHKEPHKVDLRQINFKEQILIGTRVYTKQEFQKAVEFCKVLEKDLEKVVSHIVPLKDSDKVFDMISDEDIGTVKVVVDCSIE